MFDTGCQRWQPQTLLLWGDSLLQFQRGCCIIISFRKLLKRDDEMTFEEIKALDQKYYMNTFGERTPLCFVKGEGINLTDVNGETYKDFFAGIAVSSLGHGHPRMVRELKEQVENLLHVSNVYYIESQARLAQILVENTCADRVFFANTGAEANEGAIKLAKKYFSNQGKEKYKIVTLKNSFHGRTLATVAATGQEKYQKPYRPLLEKFVHIEANDCAALENAVDDQTAAIMIELIQGESGVHPMNREFVDLAVRLCKERDMLLIVDEVQTGVGRTGKLFAYEQYGIEPDIFTMAKGLGGGVPIGAFGAKQRVASAFVPGDHGTTFGGNPLSTRAGCVVMDELVNHGLLDHAAEAGTYFGRKLLELQSDKIAEIRGVGLMRGVEFKEEIAKDVAAAMMEHHYLVGAVGTRVLRLVPPLVVTDEDIDTFIENLEEVLK